MDFTNVTKALTARGFKVSSFETAKEAAEYLNTQIDGATVGFGGSITLLRPEDGIFREMPLLFDYSENSRGLGLADMAKALRTGRAARADIQQTLHVLEIMTAIEISSREGRFVELTTSYERRPAMAHNPVRGILD